jgi:hypothetical protein
MINQQKNIENKAPSKNRKNNQQRRPNNKKTDQLTGQ